MLYMTERKKRNIGIVSITPIIAFSITFVYEYGKIGKLLAIGDHHAVINRICDCYSTLVLLYGISTVAAVAVLLYFVLHIARVKLMNGATKIMWIVFLAALMPLSFPVFWYLQVRKEPRMVETKEDIA